MLKLSGKARDITGQKFGSLTAVEPSHKNEQQDVFWLFRCDCGNDHVARGNTVRHQAKKFEATQPDIPSCGCVELAKKTKHGFRKLNNTHAAYRAYNGMWNRCYNPENKGYKWYGAIGVTICAAWKDHPEVFVEWSIANGWKKGLHIDKDILCEKLGITPHIYSPETCLWVTPQVNVGFATNRDNYGLHPNVRLSNADADEICRRYATEDITGVQLAIDFGVKSPSSIYSILRKRGVKKQ